MRKNWNSIGLFVCKHVIFGVYDFVDACKISVRCFCCLSGSVSSENHLKCLLKIYLSIRHEFHGKLIKKSLFNVCHIVND